MTKRYIIDKADIHDLLAGKELSLSQGRESAFCITISENMTNGDMIKAVFPNCEVKFNEYKDMQCLNSYSVIFDDFYEVEFLNEWWNSPYRAESEEAK